MSIVSTLEVRLMHLMKSVDLHADEMGTEVIAAFIVYSVVSRKDESYIIDTLNIVFEMDRTEASALMKKVWNDFFNKPISKPTTAPST